MSNVIELAGGTGQKQFEMARGAFVLYDSFKLGRIQNVSMEGLSFCHTEDDGPPSELHELDVFLTEYDFHLEGVPIESHSIVKTYKPSSGSIYLGHYSVRFGRLTMRQRSQLQYFIHNYTLKELH